MKKNVFLIFIVAIIAISCKDGKINFKVEDTAETTINSFISINLPFNLPIIPVNTTATQEFQNQNTLPELVESVIAEKIVISIASPQSQDFSMLKEIHIFIKKSDDSNRIEIANLTEIESTEKNIELNCLNANLAEYLREDSYKIDIQVKLKEILTQDTDIKIDLKFDIIADVL